MNNNKIHFREW